MLLEKPHIFPFSKVAGVFLLVGLLPVTVFSQVKEIKTQVISETPKTWELKWNMQVSGENYDEGFDSEMTKKKSTVVDSRIYLGLNYWLSPELQFNLQPGVKFQSGRNQAIDGADNPSNSVVVRQAAVEWIPSNEFILSAGALNQREIHSPLVSDDLPFPALRATVRLTPENWDLRLLGETSIPASNGLLTGTTEVEPNPTKNVAQIQVNFSPKPYLQVKNKIGYFSYSSLPREVANASARLGNTTTRLTPEDYEFLYPYQGYEASSDWQLPVHRRWDLLVSLAGAQNTSAPDGLNKGYSAGGGLRWLMSSRHHVSLTSRYFRVEPDVAPAYFSNRANFRTNRVGYETTGLWHLRKQKFSIGFTYQEAQVIYQEFSQSRARLYLMKLETDYASL